VDGPFWQALFSFCSTLAAPCHMSGLLSRRICPLALMTFDAVVPIIAASLMLMTGDGMPWLSFTVVVVHHASSRLPNFRK
jgi:hypothetical protein